MPPIKGSSPRSVRMCSFGVRVLRPFQLPEPAGTCPRRPTRFPGLLHHPGQGWSRADLDGCFAAASLLFPRHGRFSSPPPSCPPHVAPSLHRSLKYTMCGFFQFPQASLVPPSTPRSTRLSYSLHLSLGEWAHTTGSCFMEWKEITRQLQVVMRAIRRGPRQGGWASPSDGAVKAGFSEVPVVSRPKCRGARRTAPGGRELAWGEGDPDSSICFMCLKTT